MKPKPKVSLWEHYGKYYEQLQTNNARMNLLWWLQEQDPALEAKVRELVKADCPTNPNL